MGVIALQCPVSGLLHVQSKHLLVEVLDDQRQPCQEGEIGQVVVTDLHNFAMLLIRYALRDWAEVGPPCPCGRGLPTLRHIMGRTRNMAMSPDGKPFWPVLETRRMMEAIPQLRQYQFVQTAFDAITVMLVCDPAPTPEQIQQLQVALEQMLGHTCGSGIQPLHRRPAGSSRSSSPRFKTPGKRHDRHETPAAGYPAAHRLARSR